VQEQRRAAGKIGCGAADMLKAECAASMNEFAICHQPPFGLLCGSAIELMKIAGRD
jgi:hypothetical protein